MLLKKMQQYWMSILKNKKIFMGNYYICKIFAMILIVLIVFTGCGQNRITEKEEKKEQNIESTNIVETKAVKMIATVTGYSSYDRRDILVHVVDTEFPKITKIKDLDFEIGQVINYDDYFKFSDNDC